MLQYYKLNIWGAFKKAERELRIPTQEPDTDNAGVGKCYTCNISEIIFSEDNLFFSLIQIHKFDIQ